MSEPKEQSSKVDGEYGDGYQNTKVPDPEYPGKETDAIVYDGELIVGPQGE